MCGIVGIIGEVSKKKERVEAMLSSQKHRGPDDTGMLERGNLLMGHNRLAIIDKSCAGQQPMSDPAGRFSISFNGEIYNYKDLRRQLRGKGYSFDSKSDSEVLLSSLIEWGGSAVEHLNGDFAFAFHDRERGQLLLGRDRLGIKPLYFHKSSEYLIFASELRAILCSGLVEGRLNEKVLPIYLNNQSVPPPATLIDSIRMLPPAHLLRTDGIKLKNKRYWDLSSAARRARRKQSITKVKRNVRDLVKTAIKRQMTGDVAQGAFLSGGMDSSVVVGVMSEISSTPVKTITLNFQDEGFNDGYYARLVADRFNTDHHEISLSKEEVLQHVEAGLKARDHPSKDGINSYVVSKAAKDAGLKVALTGIGGDELFGGYQYFKHMRLLYRNHWIWSEALNPLRRGLIRILSPSDRCTKLQKVSSLLHTDGSFQELYRRMRQFFFPNQIRELLTQDPNLDQIYDGRLMESFKKSKDLEETSRISIAEINSYLHDVLLRDTDQMGLAHSLELRVPLLDHDLVSYVVGLGDDVKTDGSNSKSLFVDAMEDYIPTEIKKRKSEGFRMPFERWLRNSLTGLAEEGLSRLAREPSFETTTVHDYWRRFLNHDSALTASRILLLVSLGHWLNQIDRLADQPEIQN